MANPHADIPAGIGNENVLCHKEFLGKVCKESQYHLIGEASEGFVLSNNLSAHEHSFTSSSGGLFPAMSAAIVKCTPLPAGFVAL